MAELFDWRTIVSRRMVFGVGRLTENRLVNVRVGTTFYCFGVELPLFLWRERERERERCRLELLLLTPSQWRCGGNGNQHLLGEIITLSRSSGEECIQPVVFSGSELFKHVCVGSSESSSQLFQPLDLLNLSRPVHCWSCRALPALINVFVAEGPFKDCNMQLSHRR